MNIYIGRNGKQNGPFTLQEVNAQLATRHFLPTDLAWYDGMTDWQPLSTIPGVVVPSQPASPPTLPPPPKLTPVPASSTQGSSGTGRAVVNVVVIGGLLFGLYFLYNYVQDKLNKSAKMSGGRELRINNGSLELWRDGKYLRTVYTHLRSSIDGGLISENVEKVEPVGDGDKYAVVLLKLIIGKTADSKSGAVVQRVELCLIRDGTLERTLAISGTVSNEKPDKGTDDENDPMRAGALIVGLQTYMQFDETSPEERKKKMPKDFTVRGEDEVKITFADGTEKIERIER